MTCYRLFSCLKPAVVQLSVPFQLRANESWWVQVNAPSGGLDLADLLGGSSGNDGGSTAVPEVQSGLSLQGGSTHAPEQSVAASELDDIFGVPSEQPAGDCLPTFCVLTSYVL